MSSTPRSARRASRRILVVLAIAAAGLTLAGGPWGSAGTQPAAGQAAAGEVTPQTDAAVPAQQVLMLGSSPREAPAETWGIGRLGAGAAAAWALVRYSSSDGWSVGPPILDHAGQTLAGFVPDKESALAGSVTPDGSVALLGSVPGSKEPRELLLVRAPGQAFRETASEAPLEEGERLFTSSRAPMVAALGEGGGVAGALVVPVGGKGEPSVLHWSGSAWTREPIEVPEASREAGGFAPLAIAASSPGNAWLLARLSSQSGAVGLFRRQHTEEGETWKAVSPAPGASAGAALEADGEPIVDSSSSSGQLLDVTDQGVWVDGQRPNTNVPLTAFFKPAGEEDSGEVLASWCNASGGSTSCTHGLPERLPAGASRSFAWSNSSTPYGERVITGLPEGDTLRLEPSGEFALVLARGSGPSSAESVGASFGAAFSSPTEGWLGNFRLPVHLTVNPEPDRLEYYPVPFRRPLLAIASQPGAPVGSLSSQALAVGVEGEVARYLPGAGWQPESLLNVGGRREIPQLRAVAWPTPARAYAVGALGQMWLWRGETGLWERDPATPLNFRGNLLGVAFDPSNAARGYAVGQQGVLLRFGKTWSQERSCESGAPQPCLPLSSQALGKTSFTSVAFAGSEAIVAYRVAEFKFVNGVTEFTYTGGLLVNDGAGWHADAATALNGDIPWAVAALPDGGAAVSAESVGGGEPLILERNSSGAPWQPTPQPYPGFTLPGSLALFREGGALRVIGSGGQPNTGPTDSVPEPPAGFPPNLIAPYPLAEGGGYVLRQTAGGWRDEEHEHNFGGAPPGVYEGYDEVYDPDPTRAVLVNESGTEGWAVGGEYVNGERRSATADIARYPADGSTPPGVGGSPVATHPAEATFAIGGGAQCRAPCALRAKARTGPDTWLSSALGRAASISGVQAFIYTGPRVSSGKTEGPPAEQFPYQRELARYASLIAASPVKTFAAVSPAERALGSECPFEQAFTGLLPAFSSPEPCESGERSYYAFDSDGVRVIVLDQSQGGAVDAGQRVWLQQELAAARSLREPAIAVGNADVPAQAEHGEAEAGETERVLVQGGASAYFFYAPEENLALQLKFGSVSIPAFGSGTLGYVRAQAAEEQDFIGASGFLLAQVDLAARNPATNRAPVTVRLIPDVEELALEAEDGTLLRRSQAALFQALARRPRAGNEALTAGERAKHQSDTYIPIPANCQGAKCARGIFPEYTFSSSREDIGDFVKPNLASADPRAVLLGPEGTPEHDPQSGLFCAYNPGTTIVTISSGGLYASLPVTVQAGSVRRPCGTTHFNGEVSAAGAVSAPAPAPPPGSAPAAAPASAPPVLPAPPPPPVAAPPPAAPAAVLPPPFLLQPALTPPLVPALFPPPLPTPNPTPPSGTSAVTSPVEAAEKEEEHEEATESVSNKAVAYRASEHEPSPVYLLGIVLLAAFAGASGFKGTRRGRGEIRVAPATVSAMHSQRRMARRRRFP